MTYPLIVGVLLVVGLIGGKLATLAKLPSVTGYILCGLLLGPSFLHFITHDIYANMSFINDLAIGMLAVTVGSELHRNVFKTAGKDLAIMSIGNTMLSFLIVSGATFLLGMPLPFALILGTLSLTVSPSGVVAIIKGTKAKGEMTQYLLGLVAFDNLITILAFGIVTSLVQAASNASASVSMLLVKVFVDVLLALVLGGLVGTIISFFIRKQLSNDVLLVILLAGILLNTGIANYFGLSPILTNIIAGATITNLTNRKLLISTLFDRIELPVFVVFLTLAGAHLDLAIIPQVGLLGLGYIIGRSVGRYLGIVIFGRFTSISKPVRKNLGLGLLPQAGIAIGLAATAGNIFPEMASTITGIVLTGVIFFEIFGPLLLERGLKNVGDIDPNVKVAAH